MRFDGKGEKADFTDVLKVINTGTHGKIREVNDSQ